MNFFKKVFTSVRFLGVLPTLRTVIYAMQRDRLDRLNYRPVEKIPDLRPGKILNTEKTESSVNFGFSGVTLEITPLAAGLFQIHWLRDVPPPPYALANHEWPPVDWEFSAGEGMYTITTPAARVNVGERGDITFRRAGGPPLRSEEPPVFHTRGWTHTASLTSTEAVYGLGMRAAPLNLRGKSFRLWNTDPGGEHSTGDDPLYVCLPVYFTLSPAGCALIFYENAHDGKVEFDKNARVSLHGGALKYYLAVGDPQTVLESYLTLTGMPPLPPRWAFGYHQSRWGYTREKQVRRVVEKFHNLQIPISAIHLDIDYMQGFRVFTVDKKRFPEFAGMAADFNRLGTRLVTIIDPGVKVDGRYEIFQEGKAGAHFVTSPSGRTVHSLVWPGWSAFPDFTRSQTRAWWGANYARLLDQGVSGFWHDMNEPATMAAWGDPSLPASACFDLDGQQGGNAAAHNLYGLLMNRAGFEGLQNIVPTPRPWLLSRSGWVGSQRYAWHWTADIDSSWPALRQTLTSLLGLSLCGYLYSGSDIGGFHSHPSRELYIRWFQLAAFTPFFRTHSSKGLPPREPWEFDDETLSIVRNVIRLRYRFLPYWYTLAYHTQRCGAPLIRPMFWQNTADRSLWEISDQFFLGDALLVAPVMEEGKTSRVVILPDGDWVDYWRGDVYSGPCSVEVSAALDSIPLFVRLGSILPQEVDDKLILDIYAKNSDAGLPGSELAAGEVYLDAGDGYGASRLDLFRLLATPDGLSLERTTSGDFPWPFRGVTIRLHGRQIVTAYVNGAEVKPQNGEIYTAEFKRLFLIEADQS